jgi:perosamine synthetase
VVAPVPLAAPDLHGNELNYVTQAIKSGWISNHGDFVPRFERAFALRHGAGVSAVACSSGTAALHLSLLAAGIGRGDRVLVPDLTFGATLNTVIHVGAEPVLVDVDSSMCMDFEEARKAANIKAIIPVWLYGNEPDARLFEWARSAKITVIEDRAECVKFSPVRGDFACYSFYANKAITTGEGGMVVGRHVDAIRLYRDHGLTRPYHHLVPGLNYRLTNLAAAIGCAQMERYDALAARRAKNIRLLKAAIPGQGEWLYVVPKRPMRTFETRPVFDPMHTMPYMDHPDWDDYRFPNAAKFHRDYMCLPTGPHLSEADVKRMIAEYES